MRAVVTGATGFVGRRLLKRLDHAVVLSRNAEKAEKRLAEHKVTVHGWNPDREPAPPEAFSDAEVVFHLAGEPVAEGRWTATKKTRIRESRVVGTRHLVDTLLALDRKPRVLVAASAVGFYGSRGDQILEESAEPGDGFLAEVCIEWEKAAQRAQSGGIRVVNIRVGIVLGCEGGALAKMLTPFRWGLGSPLGNGKQWMPWIHVEDLVDMFLYAAERDQVTGPLNGTAPEPVTNREFTHTLARAVGRRVILPPVPGAALRLLVGEFGAVLITSQRALPQAALDAGFTFEYPKLAGALGSLLSNSN